MMRRSLVAAALALAVSGPALAEPLALAKPGLAMTNRASVLPVMGYAPRIVDRADALAAEAAATGIADPEAADFLDVYESLDDPNVIRAALDVALAKAAHGNSAWDWLTLAEIAIDLGLGDHDESGKPTATPDAFAREAFYDTAAGAALNGFTLAKTGGEAVSALALLVRALEAGGDSATAGRVAAYTAKVFPGFDSLDYDTDISALLRLAENPPSMPEPPSQDPPSPSLRNGDWLLTCGTGKTCLIQSDLADISVEIERAAGPAAPVAVRVVLMGVAGGETGDRMLMVDGHPLYPEADGIAFRQTAGAVDGLPWFEVPPVRIAAALDGLLDGEKLTVIAGSMRADLSLGPLRDLARKMDERQGRAGSPTALVLRGDAPPAAVPGSPRARVVAVPVYAREWPDAPVTPDNRAEMAWRTACPGAEDRVDGAVALPDGRAVFLRPCPDAKRSGGKAAFISQPSGTYALSSDAGNPFTWHSAALRPVPFGVVTATPDGPAPLGLEGWLGAQDAPCPARELYVWSGDRFVLAEARGLTDCKATRRMPLLVHSLVQEIAK